MIEPEDYELGLDAGTTNTCAIAAGEIVEIHPGFPTSPSVVRIASDGSFNIPTRLQSANAHALHLQFCKRIIGRSEKDGRLRADVDRIPHAALDDQGPYYKVRARRIELVEVWAYILGRARRAAESKFGKPPRKSVLTVPAYYGLNQCEAIRTAAAIAGFNMNTVELVTEPVAVAVDQIELDKLSKSSKYPNMSHIVVVDIGGGTTDINEVYFDRSGDTHAYVIQAIEGDNFLGGADFDHCLLGLVTEKAEKDGYTFVLEDDKQLLACENAKAVLATGAVVSIELTPTDTSAPPKSVTISRQEFDGACEKLLRGISELLDRLPCVKTGETPTAVLLAGGASQIQSIRSLCERKFPDSRVASVKGAAEAVARGAWHIARATHISIHNVLSRSIGIEAFIPNPRSENKDERRLATQQLANRNMRVPTTAKYVFITNEENQTEIELKILEGESTETLLNTLIDVMRIRNIPPCPKGTNIEVHLTIQGPGHFTVMATIKNKKRELEVVPEHFLSEMVIQEYRSVTMDRLDGKVAETRIVLASQDHDAYGGSGDGATYEGNKETGNEINNEDVAIQEGAIPQSSDPVPYLDCMLDKGHLSGSDGNGNGEDRASHDDAFEPKIAKADESDRNQDDEVTESAVKPAGTSISKAKEGRKRRRLADRSVR